MDKKSNRTDLLAAGRKKLQQFRQKKDGKGKEGKGQSSKSASTTSKVEQCDEDEKAASPSTEAAGAAADLSKASRTETELPSVDGEASRTETDLSASAHVEANTTTVTVSDSVEKGGTVSEDGELPVDNSRVPNTPSSEENNSLSSNVIEDRGDCRVEDQRVAIPQISTPEAANIESDKAASELSDADTRQKEDKVSDVGAVQEANIPDTNQGDRSVELRLTEIDNVPSSWLEEADQIPPVAEGNKENVIPDDPEPSTKKDEPASHSAMICEENDKEEEPCVTTRVSPVAALSLSAHQNDHMDQHREDIFRQSSMEEVEGEFASADGCRFEEGRVLKCFSEGPENKLPLSGVDGGSISLTNLADIIKGLSQDDYMFLVNSRGESMGNNNLPQAKDNVAVIPDVFQESLYLAHISNECSLSQLHDLSEQQFEFINQHEKMSGEISALTASLADAQRKNRILESELLQSRSELEAAIFRSEDLQNQLSFARTEMNELSAKVDELKILVEESTRKSSELSEELDEYKCSLADSQAENKQLLHSLASSGEEKKELIEMREKYFDEIQKLSMELDGYKRSVTALLVECAVSNVNLAFVTDERMNVEEEKESLSVENEKYRVHLTNCKHSLVALEEENFKLLDNLAKHMEDQRTMEKLQENFILENERLLNEVVAYQEKLSAEHGQCVQLEDDLKEAKSCIEQLNEENVYLHSTMDIHKAKIGDVSDRQFSPRSSDAEPQKQFQSNGSAGDSDDSLGKPEKQVIEAATLPVMSELQSSGKELPEEFSVFVALKGHADKAEKIVEEIEKAMEEMHSHSAFLSGSADKSSVPAVSKLIQNFESVTSSNELEESLSTGGQINNSYVLGKGHSGNLRVLLKTMSQDIKRACYLLQVEKKGLKVVNEATRELKAEFDVSPDLISVVELRNIELEVLSEVIKQQACSTEAMRTEFVILYEALQRDEASLRIQNSQLCQRMMDWHSRIDKLQVQLSGIRKISGDIGSYMVSEIEGLKKDVTNNLYNVEGAKQSSLVMVSQMVERLGAAMGPLVTLPAPDSSVCNFDICGSVSLYVNAACQMIDDLKDRLEDGGKENAVISGRLEEISKQFESLSKENRSVVGLMKKTYADLVRCLHHSPGHMEKSESQKTYDTLHASHFDTVIKQLACLLGERVQLKESTNILQAELLDKIHEMEERNREHVDEDVVLMMLENVHDVLQLQNADVNFGERPVLRLQYLFSLLMEKYKEANEHIGLLKNDINSWRMKLNELHGVMELLNSSNFEQQNEILVLTESLGQAKEAFDKVRGELQGKIIELEHSENRVASVREKLSIAVAKGKGLIAQRDSLKQELQLKEARLLEVEEKLKVYAEAGERMEALESELSYIRNSATALRESFLLKDSAIQRIEEILEDVDLPEHLHSKDITQKVDYVVKTLVSGNSLPQADLDQKNFAGDGSYSDARFMVTDAWKDDAQPNSNCADDFRKNFEELQTRFFELAEQNEMLEQSLVERNNLVQKWEEVLDRIETPPQLRSMEPEERIQWLGSCLSEADHHMSYLQQRIESLESNCESITADLEHSQNKISELELSLQAVTVEKEELSGQLVSRTSNHERLLEKLTLSEQESAHLQSEVDALQKKLMEKIDVKENIRQIEGAMTRMQDSIIRALPSLEVERTAVDVSSVEHLERLIRRMIEDYEKLHGEIRVCREAAMERRSEDVEEAQNVVGLRRNLDGAVDELAHLVVERDVYLEKSRSLASKLQELDQVKEGLQKLLSQEEQKSASLREKLNIAVRKGKSLVQHRDSLKQMIEGMTAEISELKSEINTWKESVAEYDQKIREMSFQVEISDGIKSENEFLKNQLEAVNQCLQERDYTLSALLQKLGEIDLDGQIGEIDPVQKLGGLQQLFFELRAAVVSSEQEAKKSKRAAELLLTEMNEVQERNDSLEEELSEAKEEISNLLRQRDVAESSKLEVVSHLNKLCEEQRNQLALHELLKSRLQVTENGFLDLSSLIADVFVKDMDLLNSLKASVESCLEDIGTHLPLTSSGAAISGTSSRKEHLATYSFTIRELYDRSDDIGVHFQQLTADIANFKERLCRDSLSLQEEAKQLISFVGKLQREVISQKEFLDAMKSAEKERDNESLVMRQCISLLYEACTSSVMEIESRKSQLVGIDFIAEDLRAGLKPFPLADGGHPLSRKTLSSTEEHVKSLADRLLFAVKDFIGIHAEIIESSQKDLKTTILNLQKEVQEKDIQKDRICNELANQIKEAEASAAMYLQDLQSAKTQVYDLEQRLEMIEKERSLLEKRAVDLQQMQVTSVELEEKVSSLTGMLVAKEQEIDTLMQALDEEENQMEGLKNKIEELEAVIERKRLDLEQMEAARGKALKKLSVTVNKFDELHHMSEGLLSEIENLQSQLQDRDSEISFLRQEVTKCTNDVLSASKMAKERNSSELQEWLTWLETLVSRAITREGNGNAGNLDTQQNLVCKDRLQKEISCIVAELEDLRVSSQSKDTLLQAEKNRVEELLHVKESLEVSLRQKESHLNSLIDAEELGRSTSEIVEVEPVVNKWVAPVTTSQVRSLRKGNNDQVAIAIDADAGDAGRLEDDDDDKVHGFKSLTTSRFVPKFTRPVSDMIDGLWVSCDRTLMRQPAFRLGIMLYWAVLHALLATFVF